MASHTAIVTLRPTCPARTGSINTLMVGWACESVLHEGCRRRLVSSHSPRTTNTLAHVAHCLDELKAARSEARDAATVELALWMHDAVYDPRAKDNEEKSAGLAIEHPKARLDEGRKTHVRLCQRTGIQDNLGPSRHLRSLFTRVLLVCQL